MKIKQYHTGYGILDARRALSIEHRASREGSILVLVAVSLIILAVLGLAMLSAAYGVRHRASMLKNETSAMLAAEAGYEKAVFWMGQQMDMLSTVHADDR